MEKGNILKFTHSVILLSKILTVVEDRFLKRKFYEKLFDFVFAFVMEQHSENVAQTELRNISKNVAQLPHVVQREHVAQHGHKDLLNSIDNLLDYLEYLVHISKSNATPLLVAQRNLLKFKLHILQKSKVVKNAKGVSETTPTSDVAPTSAVVNSGVVNLSSEIPVAVSKQGSVFSAQRNVNIGIGTGGTGMEGTGTKGQGVAQRKRNIGIGTFGTGTSNKEQIFNYIKKTPDIRTKEIMSEFSALSGRTVKRSLKELTDEGFLKKRSDGAAVYYTCG